MRHPFAGVIKPGDSAAGEKPDVEGPKTSRRGFFGLIAGALAAGTAGVLGLTSKAQAQFTTLAVGEEGGRPVTTRALGEEGGRPVTTRAFGEEGGRPVTTRALGEEGGPPRRGWKYDRPGWKYDRPRRVTTLAYREEG